MEKNIKSIINDIIEKIQKSANVKAVFGEPIEKGDVTVVPVSRVSVYGGGGGGLLESVERKEQKEDKKKENGSGMGMGVITRTEPVGFIQIKDDEAVFKEVTDRKRIILAGMGLGAFAVFSMTRILKKIMKR